MNEKKTGSKKIKKGDKVIAIAGNERGKSGSVLKVLGDKIIVQGLNVRKRHVRKQGNQKGSIVEIEKPIHISNLKPCTADEKPVKLKVRTNSQGDRELYYKIDGQEVLYRPIKKQTT
jgi:large subunit ribosomal protein L24